MGLLGFLWDLQQQRRIDDLEHRVSSAAAVGRSEREELVEERLGRRIDALVLVNMALWSLVRDKLGCTDQELQDRVREIDLRDGNLDGRVTTPPRACGGCGRTISARHARCIYCGKEETGGDAFASAQ